MGSHDENLAVLQTSMTNHDLRQMARDMFRSNKCPFLVTVYGFDDDPRELWEIPEVIDLFNRIISTGFVALLRDNIKGVSPDYTRMGIGSFEVWTFATGIVKTHRGKEIDATPWARMISEKSKDLDLLLGTAVADGFNRLRRRK